MRQTCGLGTLAAGQIDQVELTDPDSASLALDFRLVAFLRTFHNLAERSGHFPRRRSIQIYIIDKLIQAFRVGLVV
jgi:hypothetical protein